jgi:hypothetical protein
MKPDKIIRIIKKGERDIQPTVENAHAPNVESSVRQATRDVAVQVGAWVKEFQQRRRPDARRAFAGLFGEPASTLGSVS